MPLSSYNWSNWIWSHEITEFQYCKEIWQNFDVDISYCWLNLEVSWYSLEQYIGCIIRQAFNYYCSLLQVWREAEMQVLIWDLEA